MAALLVWLPVWLPRPGLPGLPGHRQTIKLSKNYNPFLPGRNLAALGIVKRDQPEVEKIKAKVAALRRDCATIEADTNTITIAIRKATSLR